MMDGKAGDEPSKQGTIHAARRALAGWLHDALDPDASDWLHRALQLARDREAAQLSFGLAPRRVGKYPLALDERHLASADALLPGWNPARWRVDEAARLLIAANASDHDATMIDRLARHADHAELVALYRGLPLYSAELDLHDLLGRGLRSHATPVFEAIAHDNPWPAANLDEHRWNHLVLKALFMGVSLEPLVGLQARANPTLSRMALDFADERRAADRAVPADLWRCLSERDASHLQPRKAA